MLLHDTGVNGIKKLPFYSRQTELHSDDSEFESKHSIVCIIRISKTTTSFTVHSRTIQKQSFDLGQSEVLVRSKFSDKLNKNLA